ncbi:MAG TPA: hypothetical protein VG778_07710 [Blastocatellia bacterium]|jgi:hypothetical protein|nr:hypothetical protein [Blastocatellia bacterium]
MRIRGTLLLFSAIIVLAGGSLQPERDAAAQSEFTMAGQWVILSSPIDNEIISRMGNTLGFPERHMTFFEEDGLRLARVDREDVGVNVQPLGVWRVDGNRFSATFQLWCENAAQPCGSIIMRGEFLRDDRVRGTMTAFWDEPDENRPTGYDTWPMSFRGDRTE